MNFTQLKETSWLGRLGAFYLVCGGLALAIMFSAGLARPAGAAPTPAGWQKGVTLQAKWSEDFSSPASDASIDQAKQTNANYITLTIPWQQDNIYSTSIYPASYAPSDASLVHAITKAHAIGLKVALKPHVDPQDSQWRANINPPDRNAWYYSYSLMLNRYATLAQQHGVEELVIGAELISMSTATSNPDNTQRWRNIIAQVKQRYSGLLTYSANWGGSFFTEEFAHIEFWDALDFIGISAYFGLANYTNPSVSDLMNAWNNWNTAKIQPFQQSIGKPVLFTEIGYRSVDGAAINPWDYNRQGNYNAQEQVNGIEALTQYWSNYPWFAGMQYWAWESNPNCCGAGDTRYEVQNKPGQDTMRTSFGSGTTGGGTTTPAFLLLSSSVSPASAAPGTTFNLNASIKATAAASVIIDMEVFNAAGQKVYQQVANNQAFAAGETRNFIFQWASPATQPTGQHTLSVGVFKNDWSSNYTWSSNAGSFALTSGPVTPTPTVIATATPTKTAVATATPVITASPTATPSKTAVATATPTGAATATPTRAATATPTRAATATPAPTATPTRTAAAPTATPLPSQYSLAIWWPSPGVTLRGVQTLKAKVNDLDLSQYSMTWGVDNNRQSGTMTDQFNEGAHKATTVNTNLWNWNGNGPYTITFTARDLAGRIIATNTVQVNLQNS